MTEELKPSHSAADMTFLSRTKFMEEYSTKETFKKLKALLEKWIQPEYQGKKSVRLPKGISLLDIRVLEYIYFSLKHGEKVRFLTSSLVPYLEKCGVNVDYPHDDEVNYIAYL